MTDLARFLRSLETDPLTPVIAVRGPGIVSIETVESDGSEIEVWRSTRALRAYAEELLEACDDADSLMAEPEPEPSNG